MVMTQPRISFITFCLSKCGPRVGWSYSVLIASTGSRRLARAAG
jgi:hypothetical protein